MPLSDQKFQAENKKNTHTHLYPCYSKSSLNILSHAEWNSLRDTQILSLLKTYIVVNVNNL